MIKVNNNFATTETIFGLKHRAKLLMKNKKHNWVLGLGIILLTIALFGCRPENNTENYQLLTEEKGSYLNIAWSPNGNQIVYRPRSDESYEILNLETDMTTSISIPGEKFSGVFGVVWLNNEELAYIGYSTEPFTYTIIIHNIQEQSTVEFWETPLQLFQLCWLPTEEKLIVLTTSSHLPYNIAHGDTILVYNRSIEKFRPIYQTKENNVTDITCSMKEDKIAFTERESGSNARKTWLYTITTEVPRDLQLLSETDFKLDGPSWSPNGDWIAVRSIKGTQSRPRRGLMLVSADGSTVHEIEDVPWSRDALIDVRWSPVENTLLVRLIGGLSLNARYSLALYDFTPPPIQQEE
jgi:Tol biopolymer transport system component